METKIVIQSENDIRTLHAHVCESCMRNGKQVLWMHGEQKGNETAHKCPECGAIEWKKCHIPVGQLPNQAQQQQGVAFSPQQQFLAQLFDAFLVIGAAALCIYWVLCAVEQYEKMRKPQA